MEEFHRRLTAVRAEPHAEETSAALLTGATVITLEDLGDFTDAGGTVRILGQTYTYSDADEGDVSGVPSITLDSGLLADVPAETLVEEWNDADDEVVTDWIATVTDEDDGSSNEAFLSHTLIGMIASGIPVVGESVVVQIDGGGRWWVVNVLGATPGYDPGFIRTGGLGADTVVWAGTENGRRAQLDGIDGALEAFNSANEQTVNWDGANNYAIGSFATAAPGMDPVARVAMGSGAIGSGSAATVSLSTGAITETTPAQITAGGAPGSLSLTLSAPVSGSSDTIALSADQVNVTGTVNATMGAGSVGSGTFKDSTIAAIPAASETVQGKAEIATQAETNTGTDDARIVTPLKLQTRMAAYAQPLDTDLTAIAALSSAADKMPYSTGAGTWALADISSLGRSILDDTTTAAVRTTIAAKALRPGSSNQTASYTLVLADEDKTVQLTNAVAVNLTIPPNSSEAFATGTVLWVVQGGAGVVTLVPGAGVTINSRGGLLNTNGQWSEIKLRKRATDTWVASGDLA